MTRHARRQLGSGLASGIGDSHGWNVAPLQARSPNISIPSPIPESPQEYTSFTGTPVFSSNPFPSDSGVDSDDMEATVADLIYGSSYDESDVGAASPISDWFDYDRSGIPVGATQINHNTFVAEVTAVQVLRALMTKGHHRGTPVVRRGADGRPVSRIPA